MRLKCLAGAYAGQIQDYSAVAGLAALRSGTAERLDRPIRTVPTSVGTVAPTTESTKKRKHGNYAAESRERGQ